MAPYLLPRVLSAVRRRFPDLRVLLREDPTARLVRDLDGGALDLLLVAAESDLGEAACVPLFREDFLLAVPKGHRLADRSQVRELDLEDEELLLLEDGH